ncbi:N-acetylmuramoyl-L-alanine amidase [Streptomyces finlayi]|uniref:N-acetylmuramoyl-L-alanine amidase n=1 Tax=Streptomyces finlayi TaxID=67296 RepID=A0A7G7BVD7_9ACTN|nr:peptidoglycan recognition protein [Streptomyces finlayi]QNE79302.1 N-acetylmuramoyl-L-alanine amidase [Streptomyces finlayi]
MWSRRLVLCAVFMPLAFLVLRDAPVRFDAPEHHSLPVAPPGAPRPDIVPRSSWHADERMVKHAAAYTGRVSAAFIHHTGHANGYDCADAPELLRSIQENHIKADGWDDIGYNFLVDRCGTIYEGRAGGITRPVRGAHTKGFNADTVGIAAIGTFGAGVPVPAAVVEAVARVIAWKLRPGIDPRGSVRLVSTNDESRYPKGHAAELHVVSGHRDSYLTDCPGDALYGQLPAIREAVAAFRERRR